MRATKDLSVFVLAVGLLAGASACSSSSSGGEGEEQDAATGADAAEGQDAGGSDSATTQDTSTSGGDSAADSAPAADGSTSTEAGGGAGLLGSTCTVPGDCASGLCEPFHMMSEMLCTKSCTVATQTTDCPNPPTAGTCTPNNYCKFN